DVNSHENDIDVIKFTDVNSDEVSYRGENYDLIIEYGNNDSIRVLNFFKGNQYWINEIHFADKVVTHADLYQIEIPITVSATQYDTSWSGNVLIIQLSSASSPTSFAESDSFNQVQQLTSAMAAFGSQSTAMDGINSAANENYLGNLLVANN
ncbi:calcium-binding protein, partial [Pseudomonas sp. F1_0610]|uniref:calcium-binding protein n=1 Tax=Pseudomonas sp. F1_0610 TaxID=3114284 RepID=UPI0039C06C8F